MSVASGDSSVLPEENHRDMVHRDMVHHNGMQAMIISVIPGTPNHFSKHLASGLHSRTAVRRQRHCVGRYAEYKQKSLNVQRKWCQGGAPIIINKKKDTFQLCIVA